MTDSNVIYLADRRESEPTYGSSEWIVRLHKHFDKPYLDHENDLIWFGVEGVNATKDEDGKA